MTNKSQPSPSEYLNPAADIYEAEKEITLFLDLPGVQHENLDVQINEDNLTIQGTLNKDLQSAIEEQSETRFKRIFTLSKELDTSHIDADLKDGVLHLIIPKKEDIQPRKIEVRTS